jgi:hypothetical protein
MLPLTSALLCLVYAGIQGKYRSHWGSGLAFGMPGWTMQAAICSYRLQSSQLRACSLALQEKPQHWSLVGFRLFMDWLQMFLLVVSASTSQWHVVQLCPLRILHKRCPVWFTGQPKLWLEHRPWEQVSMACLKTDIPADYPS